MIAVLTTCAGIALTFGVVSLFAASASSVPSFSSPRLYAVGLDSVAVAIADLNGDARLDVVTANYRRDGRGRVSVLLNSGEGRFEAKRDYETGRVPFSVAIGDLNGDGKPDVVTANPYTWRGHTVSVLLNRRDGRFPAHVEYRTGRQPSNVAIGDLNGDGKADLVTANTSDSTVSVLFGRGDGTFRDKIDYATGRSPQSVAIGDLNGDGKRDLAVATYTDGFVTVLINNGAGAFGPRVGYRAGRGPISIAIGDFNADGKQDLVTANHTPLGDRAFVFLNRGDGTFTTGLDYKARNPHNDYNFVSVAIGDLNGDAKPDLAIAIGPCDGCVSVLISNGDGRFQRERNYATGLFPSENDPRSVAVADLNGDHRADLVTVGRRSPSRSPGVVSVLFAKK